MYPNSHEEDIMATQDQDKGKGKGKDNATQGRKYEQMTDDGTGSAASVGPGGTGDLDKLSRQSGEPHAGAGGSMESQARGPTSPGGRTDDLLSGGADTRARTFGVAPTGSEGELQTGMGGSGSLSHSEGNRQSGDEGQQGGQAGSMQAARDRAAENEVPPSDARPAHKSGRGT
jgi:hypothetical protein